MPVISYPIPIYANVPIHAEYYTPKRFVIEDVQLGQTTIVTTVLDHDYVIGQQVRLIIPSNFGCYQLNKVKGYVISVPSSDQVEVDINSLRNVDAFVSATVSVTVSLTTAACFS